MFADILRAIFNLKYLSLQFLFHLIPVESLDGLQL